MVIRNKRISQSASEVQLTVCIDCIAVRKMLKWILKGYFYADSWWIMDRILNTPHTEQEIIEILSSDSKCFGNYEKWSRPLAEWAFKILLRENLIIKSVSEENSFYFTESCIPKKRGRPRKDKDLA